MDFRTTEIAPAAAMVTLLAAFAVTAFPERHAKALQPDPHIEARPVWAVMAFRITGIATAAATVTWLASFSVNLAKAQQPDTFSSGLPALLVIALRMASMPPAFAIVTLFASSVAKDNNASKARMITPGSLGFACRAQTVERMLVGSNPTWQEQQPISG